ncbi:MAG: HDOD domain-containing protein [Acidobacteria bacterium]|nr:HDOD domain-containing protein [Acidobacteriota bacterium]
MIPRRAIDLRHRHVAPTPVEPPPFPATAAALLRLVAKERVTLGEIAEVIASDASLLAELLRVANSAFVGARGEISSIEQAALILGMKKVAGIATSVAMRSSLGALWKTEAVRRCWLHNLASALTAEGMARVLDMPQEEAYSAALLHDIGRFALLFKHQGAYLHLLQTGPADEGEFRTQEREYFGVEHAEAGRAFLVGLGLPPVLVYGAATHHDVPTQTTPESTSFTHVACRIATSIGFPERQQDKDAPQDSFEALAGLLPEGHRAPLIRHAQYLENTVKTLMGAYERALG